MGKPHKAAPAAIGWNVIEYAPPGAVTLTAAQREDVRREMARAQHVDALRRFIDQHTHGSECDCGYCIDARDILRGRE